MADKQLSEVLKSETRKLMRELSALRTEVGELRAEVQRQQASKPEKMHRRKQAAEILGISLEQVKRLIKKGELGCIKESPDVARSSVYVPDSALAEYQARVQSKSI